MNTNQRKSTGNRILMLLENNPYPQDSRVHREAVSLTQAGCRVTVICPGRPHQPARETIEGVRIYRFPPPKAGEGIFGYLWEYGYSLTVTFFLTIWIFFRQGFDVLHVHNPPDIYVLIVVWFKLLGKRFVFDHHDLSPEMYHDRFRNGGKRLVFQVLVAFEKLSCRMADHVIATNGSYQRVEMQRGKVPAHRITVVRNGPDLNRLRRVEEDLQLRQKASTILGYVGVMGVQDGIDYLLRALKCLRDDLGRTDFYCVLIGRGVALPRLKALANELDLEQHVWFTEYIPVEDLVRYLSTADIFIDPDPSTPFNDRSTMIKMMEYMTFARPIVAFDLPEHRVSAGDAALYAPPNDEHELAKCIVTLMDDETLRQRMGQAGRQRIEDSLSWEHQERALLSAYEKLGVVLSKRLQPCQSETEVGIVESTV